MAFAIAIFGLLPIGSATTAPQTPRAADGSPPPSIVAAASAPSSVPSASVEASAAATLSPPPSPTVSPTRAHPTKALPTYGDQGALAIKICDGESRLLQRCIDQILSALDLGFGRGSRVAVCAYDDTGTVDVVLVGDQYATAEAACSGDGLISPSRVIRVVQLPE